MRDRSIVHLAAFAGASLLLFACAHVPRRAECSAHQGNSWRELTSAHFTLKTNVDSKTAQETILQLERSRSALLWAWQGKVNPPTRLEAILLQTREQLREFAPRQAGLFVIDGEGPLIVLAGESDGLSDRANSEHVHHELAHYLSSYALLRQPRWLAEGLASYLETTHPYWDQVRMGDVNLPLLRWNHHHVRVSWDDLWSWKDSATLSNEELQSHYATSWLWVHFLFNRHLEEFTDFQARLGRAEQPREAWRAAFGHIAHAELEKELEHYLELGTYSAWLFPMPTIPADLNERPISDAEVHIIRARMWSAIANFDHEIGRRATAPRTRAHPGLPGSA
jgi:hypothetical protein